MNRLDLELALRKQRLQLRSVELRKRIGDQVAGATPLFAAAGRLRDAAAWLRAHPVLPVAALVAFLVAKPSRAWRWGKRLFAAWSLARRFSAWTSDATAKDGNAGAAGI
jgi:hypothetical protein